MQHNETGPNGMCPLVRNSIPKVLQPVTILRAPYFRPFLLLMLIRKDQATATATVKCQQLATQGTHVEMKQEPRDVHKHASTKSVGQ